MTPKQIALVQGSWAKVQPISDAAATLFYHKLFSLDPSLKPLFRGDMKEQGAKLMAMITFAVQGLSRLDRIVPGLEALGRRHAGYGVKERHYAIVASALLWTLTEGLGDDFTPETSDAWAAAYELLSGTMQEAARMAA